MSNRWGSAGRAVDTFAASTEQDCGAPTGAQGGTAPAAGSMLARRANQRAEKAARGSPLSTVPNMWRRVSSLGFKTVLALAVLVVGHNLVFLLAYGPAYAAALAQTGHGSRWDETVRAVLAAVCLLTAAASVRVAYLHRLVRRSAAGGGPDRLSAGTYARALLPLWARVFAIAVVLFVVQENYERASAGLTLPGLGVLGSTQILGPVPVFLLVSLAVAAVAALFRWGIAALEEQIAAGRARLPAVAPEPRPRFRTDPIRSASSVIARNLAGRAPPAPLPA